MAETKDPHITCNAKDLEDRGKRSLSHVIPLVDMRVNQIGLPNSGGAKGGGDWGGRVPPFVTRIDFLIRPKPRRNCRGRGEISQRYFNIL